MTSEEKSLERVLPLAAEHGLGIIALALDDNGIPPTVEGRFQAIEKIVRRAEEHGMGPESILADTITLAVGADSQAANVTLGAMHRVRQELGLNLTAGASNVSFGLPRRTLINEVYLSMAIAVGLNCPIVDAAKVRHIILTADLLAGRDKYAARFLDNYRREQAAQKEAQTS